MTLKGRNFLKLMDYTPEEIMYLIDLAAELKEQKKLCRAGWTALTGVNWRVLSLQAASMG